MKDFLGNDLQIGDRVVFAYQDRRNVGVGIITDVLNTFVVISYKDARFTYDFETTRKPYQLVIIK